jgi:transcriptional regulator with XRE-family HTH domain
MFAEIVRNYRRQLGLTQEQLAARAGLSARHIRHIEAGRITSPRPGTVRLLADAFNLHGPERHRFHERATGERTDGRTDARPTPAQLPLDVHGFSGRAGALAHLDLLLADSTIGRTQAVVISAIGGTAGVGKTALAVQWAHQVRDRFPDGQLYVNLRGFDPSGGMMRPTRRRAASSTRSTWHPDTCPSDWTPRRPSTEVSWRTSAC